jgi:hypothetical protein
VPPQPMAKLTDEQRCALEALARHRAGCAEAVLSADGFSVYQLVILVIEGFATMQRRRSIIGGRDRAVAWLQISEAGRKAIGQ